MMATRKSVKPTDGEAAVVESKFSKEQLIVAERFRDRKDIVNALLASDEQYTVEEVTGMIEEYMKGKVN